MVVFGMPALMTLFHLIAVCATMVDPQIPWSLDDEENWNRTNRFSGYMFVICGIVFLINAFLLSIIPVIFVIIVGLIVPVIYSYAIYKKGKPDQ